MSWISRSIRGAGFLSGAALVCSMAVQQARIEVRTVQYPAVKDCRLHISASLLPRSLCAQVLMQVPRKSQN